MVQLGKIKERQITVRGYRRTTKVAEVVEKKLCSAVGHQGS